MTKTIPTSFGLLTLSVVASGCSDAHKVASTFEKVCKAECECPDSMDEWKEVSNCKDACRGYSIQLEAYIADHADGEPCGDLDKILKDIKSCTKNSCGDSRDECMYTAYYDLYQCWNFFGGGYQYPLVPSDDPTGAELVQTLMKPIPGALDPENLHSAKN